VQTLRESSTRNLILVVLASVAISGVSLALLYAFPYSPSLSYLFMSSFALAATWLWLLIYAIRTFGKRSLWFLLGAPPVLWVVFVFVSTVTCGFWPGGCP
jgi:hypothetical protein